MARNQSDECSPAELKLSPKKLHVDFFLPTGNFDPVLLFDSIHIMLSMSIDNCNTALMRTQEQGMTLYGMVAFIDD